MESNKLRLCESCKAVALLYSCALLNEINVCFDSCTLLYFNTHCGIHISQVLHEKQAAHR